MYRTPHPHTLVNLTPHPVTLRLPDGTDLTLDPAPEPARVSTLNADSPASEWATVPVPVVPFPPYGPVEGLPLPTPGKSYIVSLLVLARCAGRTDVFAPATGPKDGCIRDDKGQVVAVTRLVAAP